MELSLKRIRLIKKLFLIYALNVADWACTVALLSTERFYEANPLARQFIYSAPMGFLMKCLFPALVILAVGALLRILSSKELVVADSVIAFVLVFYLAINLDHVLNFMLLIFQISP